MALLHKPAFSQPADRTPSVPPPETVFASLFATTGLVGCAAILLASIAHVELFSSFRWETADIQTALLYVIPLQLFSATIMLPNYSSWSLSKSSDSDVAALKQALAAWGPTPGALPASARAAVPRSPTGGQNPLRNKGMFMAQNNYIVNNPTRGLSVGLEAAVGVLASLAGELLYRGVIFVVLTRWVSDRLYEGGADDTILLPVRILGSEQSFTLTTNQAAQLVTTGLSALLLVAAAAQKDIAERKRYERDVDEMQASASLDAKGQALLAAASKAAKGEDEEEEPRILPLSALPGAYDVKSFADGVKGMLELTKLLTMNSVFIATGGNLAATFAASATNTLVLSLLKRFATQRLEEVRGGHRDWL
ncbi:MAG: hypothetical protein WDW36_001871 [Sanguina aurantia]